MNQCGNGVPVFEGARGQRGHGLGSILSGLFRSAVPLLKKGLAFFGKQALRTGAQIANDVADGQSFGESAKKRVGDTVNEYVPGLIPQSGSGRHAINEYISGLIPQSGSGKRRRRIKRKRLSKKKDIFG